jgi:hypothetical protein
MSLNALKAARSLRRWVVQGIFPPADRVVNNRNYWWEATLIEHERRLVAERPTVVAETSPTA